MVSVGCAVEGALRLESERVACGSGCSTDSVTLAKPLPLAGPSV